jgi:hypothetical protein
MMSRPTVRRAGAVLGVVLVALAAAMTASAHWHGGSFEHGENDTNCNGKTIDPIGVIFHGSAATIRYLGGNKGDIHYHTGWGEHSGEHNARYITYGVCKLNDDQVSQHFGFPHSRYHIRLWRTAQDYAPGKHAVAGTPHHENWVWWTENHGCGSGNPFDAKPGDHAIDPGAVDRGKGYQKEFGPSGYDKARSYLARRFDTKHHKIEHAHWHNSQSHKSCEGYWVGSNGTVDIISVGK